MIFFSQIKAFFSNLFKTHPAKCYTLSEKDPASNTYNIEERDYGLTKNETKLVEQFHLLADALDKTVKEEKSPEASSYKKSSKDLAAMTKKELIEYARSLGIYASPRDKKPKLIERILELSTTSEKT